MNVTGFMLRQAIKRWELRRDTAAGMFDDSLMKFEGDDKLTPDEVARNFEEAETAIGQLQTAQARYNLAVTGKVNGVEMTLCEMIKRVGGAGRKEKMWRVATGVKKDRYALRDEMTRKTDEVRAQRTISVKDIISRANAAGSLKTAFVSAIAKGNITELPIEKLQLDPKFLTE